MLFKSFRKMGQKRSSESSDEIGSITIADKWLPFGPGEFCYYENKLCAVVEIEPLTISCIENQLEILLNNNGYLVVHNIIIDKSNSNKIKSFDIGTPYKEQLRLLYIKEYLNLYNIYGKRLKSLNQDKKVYQHLLERYKDNSIALRINYVNNEVEKYLDIISIRLSEIAKMIRILLNINNMTSESEGLNDKFVNNELENINELDSNLNDYYNQRSKIENCIII